LSAAFTHPSRPGFYGTLFSPELRHQLAQVCDLLVPGDEHYPSGSVAQVPRFVEERASHADLTRLEQVMASLTPTSAEALSASTARLESEDPVAFLWLRELVYHGYYASRRVIAAMTDRGYDYHGAPQPLGYRLPGTTTGPQTPRGSYIRTEEVGASHA
jgi:hypothetical protein